MKMYKIILFLLIIPLLSCSFNKKKVVRNDLNAMKLHGNVIKIQEKKFSDNDSLISIKTIVFNNNGYVTSINYIINNQKTQATNIYSRAGRLIQQDLYNWDSLAVKQVYKKGKKNADTILMYGPSGKLNGLGIMKYDKNHNVINSRLYNNNKNLVYSENSFYDSAGNLIELKIKNNDSLTNGMIYKFEYDSLGRKTSYVASKNGKVLEKELYFYKKVDQNNNWIEKIIKSENGKKIEIVKRIIEYK